MYQNPIEMYPKTEIWNMGRPVFGNNYNELKAQLWGTEELVGVYEEDGETLTPLMLNKTFYNFYERMARNGQIKKKGYLAVRQNTISQAAW